MNLSNIMIDTQIWIFSKKAPKKVKFDSDEDFDKAMILHEKALEFFSKLPEDSILYFSTQEIGELFHSLSFRGSKVPLKDTKGFIHDLINSDNVKIIPYVISDLKRALDLSTRSNIHIWDYLCVIPLIGHVSKVFTTDMHFKDKSFSEFDISIENPLGTWQNI